jgi:hypothetical protein
LKELPTSIDKLTTLESLDLSGCWKLKELPTSIDKLTTLESLDLSKCQTTSKFAEHNTILKITQVFDKVIMSAQELPDSQNEGNSIKVLGRQDKTT